MKKLFSNLILIGLFVLYCNPVMAETYYNVDIPEGDVSFADEVVEYTPGPGVDNEYSDSSKVLGVPDYGGNPNDHPNAVSLGNLGSLTIEFTDNALTTSGDAGNDLWFFEVATVEPSDVSISTDGNTWIDVGRIAGSISGVDIDDYYDAGIVLWEKYYYVRIVDAGLGLSTPPTPGADIDAVAAITSVEPDEYLPIAHAGGDQEVDEGEVVTLNGTYSTAPENGTIDTYLWEQFGSGTTVTLTGANTSTATFTAPATSPESLTFRLTVTDNDGDTDTSICIINITDGTYKMPVASISPYAQTVEEGVPVVLSGKNSYDADGTIVDYSWTQVSGTTVTISGSDSDIITFISPDISSSGEVLEFELWVTDNDGLRSHRGSIVNVSSENQSPVADAGDTQTLAQNVTATLDGSGSYDPDDYDVITYSWTQISGVSVNLSDPTASQPTFTTPAENGALEFQLTVTDNGDSQGVDVCIVNIADSAASVPTADAGEDQTVSAGATVTLDGSASSDLEDGTDMEYFWRQVLSEGSAVTLSDPTSTQPTFTAPSTGDTLEFELTVTDSTGFKDNDAVVITVIQPDDGSSSNCFINTIN